jgi:Uma2 family endonuclease
MTTSSLEQRSLSEFLQLPETQPATEFINGELIQKPMPQGKHSRLQTKLCENINQRTEAAEIALTLPELRCTFGDRSILPDVAVFRWERIPFLDDGEVPNSFTTFPDWIIEILSPGQSQTLVIDKIVFCLERGTELGWLVDAEERAIIGYEPNHLPRIYRGSDRWPGLEGIDRVFTVDEVFNWLRVGRTGVNQAGVNQD